MKYLISTLLLFIISTGNFAQSPSPSDSLVHTLFLYGDAGQLNPKQQELAQMLKQQMQQMDEKSTLLFLGDNLYPQGMPPPYSLDRERAEAVINAHLALVKDYAGNSYFIPGNHDWAQGRSYGWSYLNNQETYIEEQIGKNVFLPDDGCPGPVQVPLTDKILLIILDTQWFLHGWNKPGNVQGNCAIGNAIEVLQSMNDIIQTNQNKHIIVASHHPMYSYGNHGGFNTFKDHIFPLTELVPQLYIPLPIVGSIYPLFRKIFGNIQDISHPTYRKMRNSIVNILENYPHVIHVAGHEHTLQHTLKDSIDYIISGSAAKTSFVRTKGFAKYTASAYGFARLDFYKGGEIKLQFWKLGSNNPETKPAYEKILMKRPLQDDMSGNEFEREVDLKDSAVTVRASGQYETKSELGQFFLGENYRKEWLQKIQVPVFDIGQEKGELQIIQRGGGMQTKSLRLQAADGKQYVLRSVEKYPEDAVPEFLQKTFAADLVKDQISASHPYGAVVVPYLAEAIDIYHTKPKIVFIPDDPRLGLYQQEFAGTLALFEERPDEAWTNASHFGNSENIIGTTKLLEKLKDDNDNEVDQRFTLKNRLFDMIIGDWDRHDDQWRWAEFDKKGEKGKIYRPIPRDRDQAFFVNEGLLPKIVSRRWALPKLEGFDHDIRWTPGFMFNGKNFDRSFLTELSKNEWVQVAREIKKDLTDDEIEHAVKQWPDSIYSLHGEEVIAKLKSRRDKLEKHATSYYLFLAKVVSVVGSDKHEQFMATRHDNGDVHVQVRKILKDGEEKKIIYERLFKYEETNEVRLYGLGGQDQFEIKGKSKRGIKLRVIGGPDEDLIQDFSRVTGLERKNIIYDTKFNNKFELGSESKNKTMLNPEVNNYDRRAFEYDVLMPLVTASINADDGLFLGGGFISTNHGFRKEPFKNRHKFLASYAFETSSYNFKYNGFFTEVLRDWDIAIDLDVKQPDYITNFFGLGNESIFNRAIDEEKGLEDAIDYYRLHFRAISSSIGLSKKIGGFSRFSIKHNYEAVEVEDPGSAARFINEYNAANDVKPDQYRHYTGGTLDLTFDKRTEYLTTAGVFWGNQLSLMTAVHNAHKSFSSFNSTLAFYYTFYTPSSLTMATRFGGGVNFGDYEFYQAQVLDGKSELRGFRKDRFYGDSKFYNNFEVRWKLLSFRTYIFPASLGILLFNDVGRVWLEEEDSETWHHGYGGGIWIAPFNRTVISSELGRSREETLFYLRLGFIF